MTSETQLGRLAIEEYCTRAYNNSANHGFWEDFEEMMKVCADMDTEGPKAGWAAKYTVDVKLSKIALMHSELGEMTEGVRKPGPDQHCPEFTQEEIELADCFIRGFDYAGAFGLRLAQAIEAKMAYNASRPYKHGKQA